MSTVSGKVYELLQTVVKNLDQFSITIDNPNKKGDGYSSELYFVILKEKKSDKQLHFVIKTSFTNETIRNYFPVRDLFMNEIYFFNEIWPKLKQFQSDANQKPFDKIVKCLASDSGINSETLILENLKPDGFDVIDKRNTFDKPHMEFILKQYGILHALSLAFKTLHPEEYGELSKKFVDTHTRFCDKKSTENHRLLHTFCMKSLQPGKDDKVIENYQRYIENTSEILMDGISYHGKHSVVLHGDCWSNNMLFKYGENRQLLDMRFIDFQMSKDGNPVTDLSYCFYSGGSKEILDDLYRYLEIYHQSLSETLTAFGCNPEEIYSFRELKDDWKQYCRFGFVMGLMLWKGKLTYEENAVDLTDTDEDGGDQDLTKRFYAAKYDEETFKKRTRDLIVHMHEHDFL